MKPKLFIHHCEPAKGRRGNLRLLIISCLLLICAIRGYGQCYLANDSAKALNATGPRIESSRIDGTIYYVDGIKLPDSASQATLNADRSLFIKSVVSIWDDFVPIHSRSTRPVINNYNFLCPGSRWTRGY